MQNHDSIDIKLKINIYILIMYSLYYAILYVPVLKVTYMGSCKWLRKINLRIYEFLG